MIVSGGKVLEECPHCHKWVKLNKAFLGSLHICLTPEDREMVDQERQEVIGMMAAQRKIINTPWGKRG